ncbi:MAG: TetR/AcrR family transcriptional regulator [Spirochaetales bacterium]|nr:TetR/AcrR family transcriptional regulator [Spirochaetales bacterium]
MDKNSEESKQRILNTAARIFAEKGYDGARIDEIAREAEVNKALIYYYYKSKGAILSELFRTFFKESTALLLNFVERGGFAEDAEENKRLFEAEYSHYLESNKDLLKILVVESLKGDVGEVPLFRLVDIGGNEQNERMDAIEENIRISDKEQQQIYVTEFFTGVMPFVCSVVFKEKWCKHFKITEQEFKQYFSVAMEETHEQYHKNKKSEF